MGSLSLASATPGELNPGFASGAGYLVESPVSLFTDLAVAADQSVYAVGELNSLPTIFKYTPSGTSDLSFNASGTPGHLSLTNWAEGILTSVNFQADGKVLVTGNVWPVSHLFDTQAMIARILPSGSLDTSFAASGIYELPNTALGDFMTDAVSAPSGVIYAVGATGVNSQNDFVLALTSAGAVDTSFNGGTPVISLQDGIQASIAVNSQGNIVVAGTMWNGPNNQCTISQFTPAGARDTSFGQAGDMSIRPSGYDIFVCEAYVDASGITIGAWAFDNSTNRGMLARLDSAGNLDPTFMPTSSTPGMELFPDPIMGVTRTVDGKYVLISTHGVGQVSSSHVTRTSSMGEVDTAFNAVSGSPGTYAFNVAGVGSNSSIAVVVNAVGDILVAADSFPPNLQNSSNGVLFSLQGELVVPPAPAPTLVATGLTSDVFWGALIAVVSLVVGGRFLRRSRNKRQS